jgi:hypothetical protein
MTSNDKSAKPASVGGTIFYHSGFERCSNEELVLQGSVHSRAFILCQQFDMSGSLAIQPRLDCQSNLPQGQLSRRPAV